VNCSRALHAACMKSDGEQVTSSHANFGHKADTANRLRCVGPDAHNVPPYAPSGTHTSMPPRPVPGSNSGV
jgi:hypothetical protein